MMPVDMQYLIRGHSRRGEVLRNQPCPNFAVKTHKDASTWLQACIAPLNPANVGVDKQQGNRSTTPLVRSPSRIIVRKYCREVEIYLLPIRSTRCTPSCLFMFLDRCEVACKSQRNVCCAGLGWLCAHRTDQTSLLLRDVSFEVPRGTTLGLVGHNGSGKSTTLKLVSRILAPSSGTLAVRGRVSALLELGSGFHPDLSGRDNVYLNGSLLGFNRNDMGPILVGIVTCMVLAIALDAGIALLSRALTPWMRAGAAR